MTIKEMFKYRLWNDEETLFFRILTSVILPIIVVLIMAKFLNL